MTLTSHLPATRLLAKGRGWSVSDVVCGAGPQDAPFEERHDGVCVAVVTEGTFQYRSTPGTALLAPGAVLLGNQGACFECGHEHGVGDRCLSFHFEPDYWESVVAAVPGARRAEFATPHLPPLPKLLRLLAMAEAARDIGDAGGLAELALRLAAAVTGILGGERRTSRTPSRRDVQRITESVRRIETSQDEPLALVDLATEAGMSAFHFLRVFRQVVGMTPHQFVLHTRMRRAAVRLRQSEAPITTIAFDSGFNDLSTFNHRFRQVMGANPSAYRKAAL